MTSGGTGVLADLLRSLEGLKNRKAIVLLIGGFILAVLVTGLGLRVGFNSFALGAIVMLIGVLCALFGISAAGVVLMDATRGRGETSYTDAILLGAFAFLKLVAGVIVLIIALFIVHAAVAALLYLCTIPGIGPVLFAVLLPIMLLTMACVYVGATACFSLLAPALWDGNTLGSAFARVYAVGASRPIQFLIAWLAAGLLLVFVFIVLFGALSSATLGVGGMSAKILATDISGFGLDSLMGLGGGFGYGGGGFGRRGGDSGAGYVIAAVFGISIAWAIMFAAFGAVGLMATCIVYVNLTEGLDHRQAEQYLADRVTQARLKAAEMQELAKQRAQQAQARANDMAQQRAQQAEARANEVAQQRAVAPAVGGPHAVASRCSACGAPIEPGIAFCGECGNKV